jgi:hypothetical protein
MNELSFESLIYKLGEPSEIQSDARKGNTATWGNLEGPFLSIFRGPIDKYYDVFLQPKVDSKYQIIYLDGADTETLNQWINSNLEFILTVLNE